ncbi:ArnT family glycosyltransferase [Paenibacillus sp. KN14-4R]|uniref:ArnT family glycosyltransferase n=1 Tax=Paenibacillus sp. KN14-4R TaxID=3445773 RepID=UPI003F9F0DCA
MGDPNNPNNDDVKYIQTVKLMLNEGTLAYNTGTDPTAFIMPGFPFVLAGFLAIFGQDGGGVIAFRLFQCLLQAGSLYLIFIIARYVFNSRIAFIACVLNALYLPDYFSSGVILSEALFRTIILLLVCVFITAVQSKRWGWYALIGVLTAAAAYLKPHATLFPAVLLILWWKEKYTWKEMLRFTCIIGIVYIILLSPWWIRNMITFDRFIMFTDSGGSPFLLATRIYEQMPPAGFFDAYPQYDPETIFEGSDSSAVAKGIDILKYGFTHEPLIYLYWYTIGKLIGLYFESYYWRPVLGIGQVAMHIIQALLVGLSIAGIVLSRRVSSWRRQLPVLLTIMYFTVIYIPFIAFSRYGYPNIVFLLMYTALAVDKLIHMIRLRRRKKQVTTYLVEG